MRKSFKAYENYVCPCCFRQLNKCSCNIFPPYSLILIDKNIQNHIRILNEKKYITIGCCESHYKGNCITLYIAFALDYNFNHIPDGFKYNKDRHTLYYDFNNKLSKNEYEEKKREKIEVLLKWCEELEKR